VYNRSTVRSAGLESKQKPLNQHEDSAPRRPLTGRQKTEQNQTMTILALQWISPAIEEILRQLSSRQNSLPDGDNKITF